MRPLRETAVTDGADQGFRASPQQRFLWSALAGLPGTAAHQLTVHLSGGIDHGQLERAIRSVTARHEILRTTFSAPRGLAGPLQHIGTVAPGLSVICRPADGPHGAGEEACLER